MLLLLLFFFFTQCLEIFSSSLCIRVELDRRSTKMIGKFSETFFGILLIPAQAVVALFHPKSVVVSPQAAGICCWYTGILDCCCGGSLGCVVCWNLAPNTLALCRYCRGFQASEFKTLAPTWGCCCSASFCRITWLRQELFTLRKPACAPLL